MLPAALRLAEIPGVSEQLAAAIIAETGLDMTRFPTAAPPGVLGRAMPGRQPVRPPHRPRQEGTRQRLPARQPRPGRHRIRPYRHLPRGAVRPRSPAAAGKAKAQVAVARSILIIIWHLLNDRAARYTDLGPDYVASRTDRDKKIRNHVRGLRAMGLEVTLTPAA